MSWLETTDLAFELRFKDCHAGLPAVVIGKSPWAREDVAAVERACPSAIRIGVNDSAGRHHCLYSPWLDVAVKDHILPGVLHVCQDTPVFREIFKDQPDAAMFFTSPPELPPGEGRFNRRWPRPWGCAQFTSTLAVWLAWYMGCSPVYLAGLDFRPRAGRWYDTREVTGEYAGFLAATMPENRGQIIDLAQAMELDGREVIWYGRDPDRA